MDEFKLKDGRGSYHVNLNDPNWWEPSENPFGWGCCHCGSWHWVKYLESNGPLGFMLYVTDDPEETKRLQEYILAHPNEYPGNYLQQNALLSAEVERLRGDMRKIYDIVNPEKFTLIGLGKRENAVREIARRAMEGSDGDDM